MSDPKGIPSGSIVFDFQTEDLSALVEMTIFQNRISMLRPGRNNLSAIALVVSNIIPIFGVLFFGWDIFTLFLLYWLESGVIGFYGIVRLTFLAKLFSFFLVPFFLLHYGAFMGAHLVFLYHFFGPGDGVSSMASLVPFEILLPAFLEVRFAILGLLISHGISFFANFLGAKEYRGLTVQKGMMAPYKRITIMHVTIVFGGILIQLFGAPIFGLIILVVIKTAVDLVAHFRSHKLLRFLGPLGAAPTPL